MAIPVDVGFNTFDCASNNAVRDQFRSDDDVYGPELQKQSVSPPNNDFTALRKQYFDSSSHGGYNDSAKISNNYVFCDDTQVDRLSPKSRPLSSVVDEFSAWFNKVTPLNYCDYEVDKLNRSTDVEITDCYESDFDEWKGKYTREQIAEIKRKLRLWNASMADDDLDGDVDTSGAFVLEIDGPELEENNYSLYHYLNDLSIECRRKIGKYNFTNPGEPLVDGGMQAFDGDQLDKEKSWIDFAACARFAIEQYNDHIDKVKLEYVSVVRATTNWGNMDDVFVTFTAIDLTTNQIGTYQGALTVETCMKYADGGVLPSGPNDKGVMHFKQVHLVFLRHVDADKVLFLMTITGIEE